MGHAGLGRRGGRAEGVGADAPLGKAAACEADARLRKRAGAGRERGRRRRAEEDAMGGGGGGVTRAQMRLQRVQRMGAEEEVEAAKGGRRRAHPVGAWGECPVVLPAERPRGMTTERRCPYAFFR
jgi:hypothetical protein